MLTQEVSNIRLLYLCRSRVMTYQVHRYKYQPCSDGARSRPLDSKSQVDIEHEWCQCHQSTSPQPDTSYSKSHFQDQLR